MVWSTRFARRALWAALILSTMLQGAQAQQAVLDAYQESAGLTSMAARSLSQDVRGALWIGTDNGLFRFDGFRIHREPMPVAAGYLIDNVLADRIGRVWVVTDNGLYLRREASEGARWTVVTMADGSRIQASGVQSLDVDDRGVLSVMEWTNDLVTVTVPDAASQPVLAQPARVPHFEPFEGTPDASSGPVRSIAGALWFGCGSGLCTWKDGRLKTWGPAQGLPSGAWSALLASHDGSLWARSSTKLARLAPAGDSFGTIDAPAEHRWAGSIALVEDRDGAIVTTTDAGVARWDGHRWQAWTPRDGLPETAVRSLLFDAQGTFWIGTSGRGLHRWIGYGQVDHWTPASGLPSPVVKAFARAIGGRLWVATASGIASFDPAQRRFVPLSTRGDGAGNVDYLAVDAFDNLWWVEAGKLLVLRGSARAPQVVFADSSLSHVVQGPDAIYLVGGRGAERLVISPTSARREPIAASLPDAEILKNVITDGTNDWFLTGRHAYRAAGGGWMPMLDEHGVPVEVLGNAAFTDPSALWAADDDGVSAYRLRDGIAYRSSQLPRSSFGEGAVLFVRADAAHHLWLGTDRGLFIHEQGRWWHIDRESGLLWNDIDEGAFLLDPDGTAWVGTSAGATEIHPGARPAAAVRLRLDEVQFGDTPARAAPGKAVAWADRSIRVTVGTADTVAGAGPRVEYRLHDSEPWQAIDGNVVRLESLQPDSYALQMRSAATLPLDQAGPPMRLDFEVAPPWWLATPAKAACAAGLAALWYLSLRAIRRRASFTRRRLEQAIAQRTAELERSRASLRELGEHNARSLESERRRVSRELHDEMGQQLAALRMEVSVMRMRLGAAQPLAVENLDTLLDRVDRLVASVRTLVSQLRPPALDGGLIVALEWLAADLMRGTGVQCHLALDAAVRDLPADVAAMLFRIVQESFSNVRRHAQARRVDVALRPSGGRWVLEIRDDGVGFDPGSPRTGFGLLGMAERARALGGALSIDSEPGEGTTLRLEIALRLVPA